MTSVRVKSRPDRERSPNPSSWHARFPMALLTSGRFSSNQVAVLIAMFGHADRRTGTLRVRQSTLATYFGKSRPWVNGVISELIAMEAISSDAHFGRGRAGASERGLQEANEYKVLLPEFFQATREPDEIVGVGQGSDTRCQRGDTHVGAPQQIHAQQQGNLSSPARRDVDRVDVAEDWCPTAETVEWILSRRPDLDIPSFQALFVSSCRANGYRYKDPDAGFRQWAIEDLLRNRSRSNSNVGRADTVERRSGRRSNADAAVSSFDAWAMVARGG